MTQHSDEPRLTFERFRSLTLPLSGAERAELFFLLRADVRDEAWEALREQLEQERAV